MTTAENDIPDLASMPCAGFLEDFVRELAERDLNPQSIGVCVRLSDGCVLTGYYQASPDDKALFAHHIQSDALFDEIEASAGWLAECIAEADDEDEDGEDED